VGAEFFHAGGHGEANGRFSQFCEFAEKLHNVHPLCV
jgi:hypothetical protein